MSGVVTRRDVQRTEEAEDVAGTISKQQTELYQRLPFGDGLRDKAKQAAEAADDLKKKLGAVRERLATEDVRA
jgi:hypothetical protein